MKKLLTLAGLLTVASLAFAATTKFTETLPPAQPLGTQVVADGYAWNATSLNYPATQSVTLSAVGNQITPSANYILLSPSGLAANAALTGTPTISTATVLGGAVPFVDGTMIVVASTGTTAIELQDNGSLAGSQLFLSGATQGNPQAFVTVSSTRTAVFVYSATNKGWNFIGR